MNKRSTARPRAMSRQPISRPLLSLSAFILAVASAVAATQPNIVLIMADDMGYADIGCYGAEIETPNLDRLAAEGAQFSHFYNTGRCCPSRASLLTGLYAHQVGVGAMLAPSGFPGYASHLRPDNNRTIAEVLKSAGYGTYMTGKWHIGTNDVASPRARGFDRFYGARNYIDSYFTVVPGTDVYLDDTIVNPSSRKPVNHLHPEQEWYTTNVFTDYALHFLDGHRQTKPDAPFFLYLAFNAPHWPLHALPEDLAKYRGKYRDMGWTKVREQRLARLIAGGLIEPGQKPSEPDAPAWDTFSPAMKDELDLKMALYAAMVDRLDQNVGRVIEWLKTAGLFDSTLVVFLSDNGGNREGGMFGYRGHDANPGNYDTWAKVGDRSSSYGQGWANVSNTPLRRYKCENHEGGIAAPFIARWPAGGIHPGVTHQVAHIIDLLPTFAEVAAATYPQQINGQAITPAEGLSLLPVLQGGTLGERTLFWEHEGNRAVRNGNWKLVARTDQPWELYDMTHDRTETVNALATQPAIAARLIKAWDAWAARANVLPYHAVRHRRVEGSAKK